MYGSLFRDSRSNTALAVFKHFSTEQHLRLVRFFKDRKKRIEEIYLARFARDAKSTNHSPFKLLWFILQYDKILLQHVDLRPNPIPPQPETVLLLSISKFSRCHNDACYLLITHSAFASVPVAVSGTAATFASPISSPGPYSIPGQGNLAGLLPQNASFKGGNSLFLKIMFDKSSKNSFSSKNYRSQFQLCWKLTLQMCLSQCHLEIGCSMETACH